MKTSSLCFAFFFFSSRRRHTICSRDWSSDVCSSDLLASAAANHLSGSPVCYPPLKPSQQRKSVLLGRKRAAAAAVARRVGILEDESLAHQRLFVLERRAVQIQKTFRVDEEARAELFEDFVPVAGL